MEMWLLISTAVSVFTLTLNLTQARNDWEIITRSRKPASWFKLTSGGIELCVNQCDDNRDCRSNSLFKGTLTCGLHGNNLAIMVVTKSEKRRTSFVTVLNKTAWKKCPNLHCGVIRALTSVNRRASLPEQKKTPLNRITLRKINYIAASTRYSSIVYGHGPRVESTDRILSFNITRTLSVGEHTLDNGMIRNIKVITCGLTTGSCYTRRGSCVYICYRALGRPKSRLRIFDEPNIDQDKIRIKTNFFCLTRKRPLVKSIAMDRNGVLYALRMGGRHTTITAFRITGIKYIHREKIKEFIISVRFHFLDISKDDNQILLVAKTMVLLSPDNIPNHSRVSSSDLLYLNKLKRRGRLVCWLADGRHIVFMESRIPFKFRNLFLNPR